MTLSSHTVSRHFFRRTARREAGRFKREGLAAGVEKAKRGPFLWSVVIYEKRATTSSAGVPIHHWR